MTIKYADRVMETTKSTGTGSVNLEGAVQAFQTFVDGVGDGALVNYCIFDQSQWETGIGTVTQGNPDTLSRDRVISSSAAGNPINWGAGTRNVILTASSSMLLWRDENGNDTNQMGAATGTGDNHAITVDYPIAGYSDRMIMRWNAPANNTGNVKIAINGLPEKTYKRIDGAAFSAGEVQSGKLQTAIYDAANDCFISTAPVMQSQIPVGFVMEFNGDTPPEDFIEEDGSLLLIADFPELFAVQGNKWGGDGIVDFALAPPRHVVVGRGGVATDVLGNEIGDIGGTEAHTLIPVEIANHYHNGSGLITNTTGNHSHSITPYPGGGNSGQPAVPPTALRYGSGAATAAYSTNGAGDHSHTVTGNTGTQGSGQAHNNMQPTMVKMKCVKYR